MGVKQGNWPLSVDEHDLRSSYYQKGQLQQQGLQRKSGEHQKYRKVLEMETYKTQYGTIWGWGEQIKHILSSGFLE